MGAVKAAPAEAKPAVQRKARTTPISRQNLPPTLDDATPKPDDLGALKGGLTLPALTLFFSAVQRAKAGIAARKSQSRHRCGPRGYVDTATKNVPSNGTIIARNSAST
jgi:hypothetical protein